MSGGDVAPERQPAQTKCPARWTRASGCSSSTKRTPMFRRRSAIRSCPLTEDWRAWSLGYNDSAIPAAVRDVVKANQSLRPEHGLGALDAKWLIASDDASF